MADMLSQLSQGLRGAAGILNPEVQRETFVADEREKNINLQFHLSQQTPQALLAKQQLENETGFRKEISELGPNPDPGGIAAAAMKWGKPELAANLVKAGEDRAARLQTSRDMLETRKLQLQQAHEATLQRLGDARARAEETTRHNKAIEALTAQGRDIQAQLAQAKIDSGQQGKPLPARLMNDLLEKGQILDSSERFVSTFKDDYGGFVSDVVGNIALQAERKNPFSTSTARPQWWQDYELHQSVIRNKLFGSALTAPEIAAWERSAISPGMNADNIRENLKRREMIERTGIERLARSAATQYNQKAIEEAMGRNLADFTAPVSKPSADNAPALPPGFKLDK